MPKQEFVIDGETVDCTTEKQGETYQVKVGERLIEIRPLGNNLFAASLNGEKRTVAAVFDKGVCHLDIDSIQFELHEPGENGFVGGAADQRAEKDKAYAPMPGKIVKILVGVGDEVKEKQPLVIVEAMKMEHQVTSLANGKVKAVNFEQGDQVDTESPLIELEVEE